MGNISLKLDDTRMHFSLSSNLSVTERDHITKEVIAHDRALVGAGAPKPISFAARRESQLMGGVCGHIELHRLYVQYLWVDEAIRGQGIGSHLLRVMEGAAVERGCKISQIECLSELTRAIYVKLGYKPVAEITDYIPGLNLYILSKRIEYH